MNSNAKTIAIIILAILQAGTISAHLNSESKINSLSSEINELKSKLSATESNKSTEASEQSGAVGGGSMKVGMGEVTLSEVPDNRASLDLTKAGLFDVPAKTQYKNALGIASLELTDISFGGNPDLPKYKGTNDTVGKDLVLTLKLPENTKSDNLGKELYDAIDGVNLTSSDGSVSIDVKSCGGISVSNEDAIVYLVLNNADAEKLKKGDSFTVKSLNSDPNSIKIDVNPETTVTLGY